MSTSAACACRETDIIVLKGWIDQRRSKRLFLARKFCHGIFVPIGRSFIAQLTAGISHGGSRSAFAVSERRCYETSC